MLIDNRLLDNLTEQAKASPRLRMNYDLRTSSDDTSQRMLNALLPGTEVPVHRHEDTSETVVCLRGRLMEILYEEVDEFVQDGGDMTRRRSFKEISRHLLCPAEGKYGMQVPKGVWHSVEVLEPSVIFEAKDGAYRG